MNFAKPLRRSLFVASAFTVSVTSAVASSGDWNVDAAGNWSTIGNWNPSGAPGTVAGDIVNFYNNITNARTVTIDTTPRIVGSLTIGDSNNTHSFTLAASGGGTLTFDNNGSGATLIETGSVTDVISAPIILADNLTVTSAGQLNFNGALNNGGYNLLFNGAGNAHFGNTTAGVISGTGGITVTSGRLTLGAGQAPAHTYSGQTNLLGGVTMFANNYSANSNININGGILESYWSTNITRTLGSGAGQIRVTGGESGFSLNGNTGLTVNLGGGAITWGSVNFDPTKFVLQSQYSQTNSNITFANALDLNGATRTVLVNSGTTGAARAAISGLISNSTGTAGFTKEGTGVLTLSNNSSSWNGNTTASAGLLDMGGLNVANIGGGTGRNISVASGASIRFNALTNSILNRLVETTAEIGVMSGGTSNNFDFSSSTGANLSNAFLGAWASNGAKAEFSGTITPQSDNYRLGARYSSGLIGIVGTNKLTGTQGLLVGQTGSSGIRVELAGANDFSGNTVINSGSKLTLGNNLALQNSALDLGSAGGTFALSTGLLSGRTTGSSATPSPTIGGLIGSRSLNSAFTASGGNNEQLLANTAVTGFTLNVGAGKSHTYSGAIGGFGTGASGGLNGNSTLTKTGAGTQTLTGVSTYSGATTINEGILAINGSGSINNSAVTIDGGDFRYNSSVAYTGTLTFNSGTLSGTNWGSSLGALSIEAGQIMSPGNSPGTAATTSQIWVGGGAYLWEINNATGTAGSDPGWDLITGSGTLTISADSFSPFNIMLTSLNLSNASDVAANFNSSQNYNWLIADFASISGFSSDAFAINTDDFQNPYSGTFSVSQTDGQLFLNYQVVPEPGITLLLGIGALCLVMYRRRW